MPGLSIACDLGMAASQTFECAQLRRLADRDHIHFAFWTSRTRLSVQRCFSLRHFQNRFGNPFPGKGIGGPLQKPPVAGDGSIDLDTIVAHRLNALEQPGAQRRLSKDRY
jgi:hypothetical protein